jgi:hypothetical protein
LPACSASFAGFVNGDGPADLGGALAFATAATSASPVGSYAVTPAGLTSNNYAMTFLDGVMLVTPAPLTVTADDMTKVVGSPNPEFTSTISGLVNGDTAASLLGALAHTTSATVSSPVGVYAISPAGLSSPNYAIQFVSGTLTIVNNLCLEYDPTKPATSGSTIPIKVRLCDASGATITENKILSAIRIEGPGGVTYQVADPGNSNAGGLFREQGSDSYHFNLQTTGLPAGQFQLYIAVSGDPLLYFVPFVVR